MRLRKNAKVELIKGVPLFAELGKKELDEVAGIADEIDLPEGRELTVEGRPGREFMVIVEGEASVRRGDQEVNRLGAGDFFGEIGLLVTGRRTASVTATSPIRLLTLFDQDFRRVCADVPRFERVLREAMAERLGVNTPSQP